MNFDSFYDMGHAQQYLQGSVIRVEEEPVYIHGVGVENRKAVLQYSRLGDGRHNTSTIQVNDDAVNYQPVPLGMVNTPRGNVRRLFRAPKRCWKVGLSDRNCFYDAVNHQERYIRPIDKLYSSTVRDCITGNHPSFEEAVDRVTKHGFKTVAFHRNWAVAKNGRIYYKRQPVPVGFWTLEGADLFNQFEYLEQQMRIDINGS